MRPDLQNSIDALSQPFESTNDVKLVSMKLDVIVATLLGDPVVQARLGAERTSTLLASSPELPSFLRVLGAPFHAAAGSAEDLLALSGSSLVDFGSAHLELSDANAARERFRDALLSVLGSLDG